MDIIRTELEQLDRSAVWNVREIAPYEFTVAFPSAELLRAVSWGGAKELPVHHIKVEITASMEDPATIATLSTVWVRVHGIPSEARKEPYLELISQAIGKLVSVDVLSLPGDGPVRHQVMCPDPSALDYTLPRFFFGLKGRSLVVELEKEGDQLGSSLPSPPSSDGDQHRDPDGMREEDSSYGDESGQDSAGMGDPALQPPAPVAPPPRLSAPAGSKSAPAKLQLVDLPRSLRPDSVEPLGLPLAQYGSNLLSEGFDAAALGLRPAPRPQPPVLLGADSGSVGLEVVPPSSPRSPGVVCYSRSPGSTPTSPLGPDTPTPSVLEPASAVLDTPEAGTKTRAPCQVPTPSRHSARLAHSRGGGEELAPTIPEQVACRAAARNLDPGTSSTPVPSVQSSSVSPPTGSRFSTRPL